MASYLGREVRTAQRWEKQEGLPIHRHRHDRSGTVYAYRAELDAWLAGRRQEPEARPHRRRLLLRVGAPLVGLVILGAAARSWMAPPAAPVGRVRLAVLPFENLGAGDEHEFFADGLAEETIHQLGRLDPRRLAVIGRSSVARYRRAPADVARIGRELDVDYVLEGSLRRERDQVRVTLQLRHVHDQAVLWTDSYDRSLSEVLAVQAEIAKQVSRALGRRLGVALPAPAPAPLTAHPGALDAYLRGRYLWNRGTRRGFEESVRAFTRAVQLDGRFARAHAGLAAAHLVLGRYGQRPPKDTFPLAKASALAALRLDDGLAEAHTTLAGVLFFWEWDFDAAEAAYRRALELDPTSAGGHHGLAHFLSITGRHAEAIAAAQRAQTLEPLSAVVNSDAAWFYYRARRYDDALSECRRVLELEPGFASARICVVRVYEQQGRHRRWRLEQLAARQREGRYVSPYSFAVLHTALGENDLAFRYLEEALAARDRAVLMLKVHPGFDPLRGDPRRDALLARVGLR